MYQPVTLYIAFKYISNCLLNRFNNINYYFSIISITLGVMSLIIVVSVMNGFKDTFEKNVLKFIPQAIVSSKTGYTNTKLVSTIITHLIPGVLHIAPIIIEDVILQSQHNIAVGMMMGVNPTDPEPLFDYLIYTKPNKLISGKYRIILGYELAIKLGVKCGDILRVTVPSINQFTLLGQVPSQRLFTVIGIFITNTESDDYQLLINQKDASNLMHFTNHNVTGWRLWLKKPLLVNNINFNKISNFFVWHDWREKKGELFQAMHMEENIMILLLSLIIIVASFNIISVLNILVIEKQDEIAILEIYGLNVYKIITIFILQGVCISICGTLFGTILGIFILTKLNYIIYIITMGKYIDILPILIQPLQVIAIILFSIILALLSTIYPSWYITTIKPIQVLRNE